MKIITFPGFTDRSKAQNPYQYLLYREMISEGHTVDDFTFKNILKNSYQVAHVHWPESNRLSKGFFKALTFSCVINCLLMVAKLKGAKVVWTVHNLKPHERRWPVLEKMHFNIFTKLVNGFIVMNNFTLESIFDLYPNLKTKKYVKIEHGHYKDYYPNTIDKSTARAALNINATDKVCLFFGQIRAYKGIEELINVFQRNPPENVKLLIVGSIRKADGDYAEKLKKLITNNQITLINKFVKDEDIQNYMNAADLVILPYKNILNSGTLLLSLSYNKPILVTNSPGIVEFQSSYAASWIITYAELTENTIPQAFKTVELLSGQTIDLSDRDWRPIALQTIDFYSSLT